MTRRLIMIATAAAVAALLTGARVAIAPGVPEGAPLAVIDLGSNDGAALVKGQWRFSTTRIAEAAFNAPGADLQPSGAPIKTYDFEPKAGGADFDDSDWEHFPASDIQGRRSTGRLCFAWYRINITVPERIGAFDPTGANIVFDTSVDDYAEIWVDGELTRAAGQQGGSMVAGWNASNRLIVGRNVKTGQRIQIAVFGINGPLSNPPTNFIWMRHARLEFFPGDGGPVAITPAEVNVRVDRHDAAMNEVIGPNPKIFKLADGFQFTEGPVWVRDGGYLLFSDPNANTIYRYQPGADDSMPGELTVHRRPSGYEGDDVARYGQPGSNGLMLDAKGRLTVNQHGNRRVVRYENDGSLTVLAERYDGKRLNSPNDLVYRSDGALFFTDPPFGLPKFFDDPNKELAFSGVYSLKDSKLRLLSKEMTGPNGIAFSPDEKYLYVGNWDDKRKIVMRYPVNADATVGEGTVFFDMTAAKGEDALDGIKVDTRGNLYVSGPGGLWVIAPSGKHIGTIRAPRHVHNMAWGGDGKTLYLCAQSGLYRMRTGVGGKGQ